MKHILIDFENIRPTAEQLNQLTDECCVWVFLGALQQKQIPVDFVLALKRFEKFEFVLVERSGKNALDFYLAYYLGKITERDSDTEICILSKDGGYDVLVEHLKNQGNCREIIRLGSLTDESREASFSVALEVNFSRSTLFPYFQKTVQYLLCPDSFKPKALINLEKCLQETVLVDDLISYSLDERYEILKNTIERLQRTKLIVTTEEKWVSYHLDANHIRTILVESLIQSRVKTIDDAKNVLSNQANSLGLIELDEKTYDEIIDCCLSQRLIKIDGAKLQYAPFEIKEAPKNKVSNNTQADIIKELVVTLSSPSAKNRPQKLSSLKNQIKSKYNITDADCVVIAHQLKQKGLFVMNGTDKITYK